MISATDRLPDRGYPMPATVAGPQRLARWASRLLTLLEVVGLTALTLGIGYWSGDLNGFPKGNDTVGHLAKVQMLLDNWPHINWNDQWYAGLPNFTGSYPPGYHLLVAAVTTIHHTSLPTAISVVTGLSLVLLIAGTYSFVRLATHSRIIAWLAALAILAQPTLWSQSLQLGLMPRLLSLGLGAAALPFAVLYGRKKSRVTGAALVLVLAAALSAHPFVGVVLGLFAAGVIVTVADGPSFQARAKLLIAPTILLSLLVSYFYVPLVLLSQGQSAAKFVNTMPAPVPWWAFVWPHGGVFEALISWTPITVPLIAAGIFVALMHPLRRPSANVDPWNLYLNPDPAQKLDEFLAELGRADERRRRYRPLATLAVWSWLFSALFVGYCVLQHFTPTFPYYVNGLFPNALLVYAAFFAVLGSAIALTPVARRGAIPLLLIGAAGVGLLGVFLPGRALNYNNSGRQLMEGMVARNIPSQHVYRIADNNPDMALFLNAYTQTPQTDGYQPQGDLHQAWQTWLEDAIGGGGQNDATRKFLFDWYAVKWILVHNAKPYTHDPSYYQLVENRTHTVDPTTLWAIRQPTPIFTATKTPPLLFIGDGLHYDLFLHTLAAANVNSSNLIPVDGGPSLAGYTLDELRSYRQIILWGSQLGARGAALIQSYARAGGRVFVDEGEGKPVFPAGAEPVGAIATKTITRAWRFDNVDTNNLPPALLTHLPAPNYAGTNRWQVAYPKQFPATARPLLTSRGHVELAFVPEGNGVVIWSGINLPYLASSTLSKPAIRLLLYLATGSTDPHTRAAGGAATRLNAEHWRFTVPAGTTSLLLREYTSVDWHASNAATGAALPIREAGPGMTLIPLPPSATGTTVDLEYRLSPSEKGGIYLSGFGVLVLLLYAAGVPWPGGRSRARA